MSNAKGIQDFDLLFSIESKTPRIKNSNIVTLNKKLAPVLENR